MLAYISSTLTLPAAPTDDLSAARTTLYTTLYLLGGRSMGQTRPLGSSVASDVSCQTLCQSNYDLRGGGQREKQFSAESGTHSCKQGHRLLSAMRSLGLNINLWSLIQLYAIPTHTESHLVIAILLLWCRKGKEDKQ